MLIVFLLLTSSMLFPQDNIRYSAKYFYDQYKDKNSCEAVYYSLFLDKKGKKEHKNIEEELQKVFNEVKKSYLTSISPSINNIDVFREWNESIENVKLDYAYDGRERGSFMMYPGLVWTAVENEQSDAVKAFILSHELSHILDWGKEEVTSCLSSSKSLGAIYFHHYSEYDIKLLDKIMIGADLKDFIKRNSDFEHGAGTQDVAKVEDLLESGNLDDAITYTGRQNQIPEALADYYATMAVTTYVKDNYYFNQKEAALDVLRYFKPHLYKPEVAEVMNKVGSKKTNEERALKIVLANKDFRELIGCNFEKATPLDCTEYNSTFVQDKSVYYPLPENTGRFDFTFSHIIENDSNEILIITNIEPYCSKCIATNVDYKEPLFPKFVDGKKHSTAIKFKCNVDGSHYNSKTVSVQYVLWPSGKAHIQDVGYRTK